MVNEHSGEMGDIVTPKQRTKAEDRIARERIEYLKIAEALVAGRMTPEIFADAIAARMAASRARRDRAKEMAFTDKLTGLYNQRGFEQKYAELVEELKAGDESAVILNIDLNDLKIVNDTKGHEAGDRMLRTFAEIMKKNVRATDTLGLITRPHGDEFLGVLRNTNQIGVEAFWRRLVPDLKNAGLQISMGSVEVNPHDPEHSLVLADRAMYQAKERKPDGKSHYFQHQSVDPSGQSQFREVLLAA